MKRIAVIFLLILSIVSQCFGKRFEEKVDLGYSKDGAFEYAGLIVAVLLGVFALFATCEGKEEESDENISTPSYKSQNPKIISKDGGEFHGELELSFEGIQVKLAQRKNKDKLILDGSIAGKARAGRLLAVMGPSGSGKSTLLHAIAGKIKRNKKLKVVGKRYINNELLAEDSGIPAAFVQQDSNFFPYMTVKETLDFRVDLKLGNKLGRSARDDVVANLLDLMGLEQSANTIVGGAKVRGLSGGERRRLSIACEMISSPPVVFLDEPTSGLDSYQAAQVVQFLRKLADNGKTVVAVIHQPSQKIFSMFDDLILLSEGRLMYHGEVKNVRSYLSNIGYKCSDDIGTAEHILNCISRVNADPEESDKRLDLLANEAIKHSKDILPHPSSSEGKDPLRFAPIGKGRQIVGPFRQFRLLVTRAVRNEARGKAVIAVKIIQQVGLASIFGGIYRLGRNQESVMDRFGLIALLGTATTNMGFSMAVRSFPKEKAIVSSEISGGMYSTFPYLMAKAIAELPLLGACSGLFSSILYPLSKLQEGKFGNFLAITSMHAFASNSLGLLVGSISPTSDVANALMAPVIVLNVIFDGRNISVENTPFLLRWLPKIGLIRWFFEGVAVNEFTGLEFETSGPRRGPIVKTGFDALERFGIAKRTLPEVLTAQTRIVAGCWVLSFIGLSLNKERFEKMNFP